MCKIRKSFVARVCGLIIMERNCFSEIRGVADTTLNYLLDRMMTMTMTMMLMVVVVMIKNVTTRAGTKNSKCLVNLSSLIMSLFIVLIT